MRVLVIGGYGVFGGRLIDLLADVHGLEILVAGRSLAKAKQFCCQRPHHSARLVPIEADRTRIGSVLEQYQPDLIVDASGPFQVYGDNPYSVVKACIEHRINYLDLADGSDFVVGISQFDEAARDAGIFALSGVSSFPVITAAVLEALNDEMVIEEVRGGIGPSPRAGIGLNVMRAVLSYTGSPIRLVRDGTATTATGLGESTHFTIAPPGYLPMLSRRFSLVDVADLQVIPNHHPSVRTIWMGAGTVPESLHLVLNGMARLRSWLKLPSYLPLSGVAHRVLNTIAWGEHRGGMFIEVTGRKRDGDQQETVNASWHLIAEGEDGPFIPAMSVEALVRQLVNGHVVEPGAGPAVGVVSLSVLEAAFARKDIVCGFRDREWDASAIGNRSLYPRVLERAFDALPETIRQLHSKRGVSRYRGKAEVSRGKGLLSRLVAKLFGFPKAAEQVPVSVELDQSDDHEIWRRNFNGSRFHSVQCEGKGREQQLIVERFGLISVALALVVEDGKLFYIPRHWRIGFLPLPRFLLPKGTSHEHETGGKFHFDVEISAPLVGLIVAYRGWLEPENDQPG